MIRDFYHLSCVFVPTQPNKIISKYEPGNKFSVLLKLIKYFIFEKILPKLLIRPTL